SSATMQRDLCVSCRSRSTDPMGHRRQPALALHEEPDFGSSGEKTKPYRRQGSGIPSFRKQFRKECVRQVKVPFRFKGRHLLHSTVKGGVLSYGQSETSCRRHAGCGGVVCAGRVVRAKC